MTNNAVPPAPDNRSWEERHQAVLQRHAQQMEPEYQALLEHIHPPTKPDTKPDTDILGLYYLWSVFTIPCLVLAMLYSWGFGTLLFAGLLYTFLGHIWSKLAVVPWFWFRYPVGFAGLATLVTAVLSVVIPIPLMLVLTLVTLPWSIPWLIKNTRSM